MPVIKGVVSGVREAGGKLEVVLIYSENRESHQKTIRVDNPITNEHGEVCRLKAGDPVDYDSDTNQITYTELADRKQWGWVV